MTYTFNGIEFTLWRWNFSEDGYAGAIYFTVPANTYKRGNNNGAMVKSWVGSADGPIPEPDAQVIRVATPYLEHGEIFEMESFWFLIEEAARWADRNLARDDRAEDRNRADEWKAAATLLMGQVDELAEALQFVLMAFGTDMWKDQRASLARIVADRKLQPGA